MKRHLTHILLLVCGIAMIYSSVMLGRTVWEYKRTAALIPAAVSRIEEILPVRSTGILEERSNMSMATISVGGVDFVGLLEVPSYNVKLPVFATWSQNPAKRPAVYLGSPYDGSLIIGVDYKDQFYFADTVETGTKLRFTDLYGQEFTYRLDSVKHADNVSGEILASEADDLTVFTKGKNSYLILRCVLCYNNYQ